MNMKGAKYPFAGARMIRQLKEQPDHAILHIVREVGDAENH